MRTTIFYKTNNSTGWQIMKLQQTKEECENLCKRYYNFSDYKIMEMEQTTPFELHLLTNIVFFEGKYYFPEDTSGSQEETPGGGESSSEGTTGENIEPGIKETIN